MAIATVGYREIFTKAARLFGRCNDNRELSVGRIRQ
jgi:hypothetical protein